MSKIIVFSGKEESGKSTASNFVFGMQMLSLDLIDWFRISERGWLTIQSSDGDIEVDFSSPPREMTPEMYEYHTTQIWPFVKIYNFADDLKSILINLFGLEWEQLYTKEGKNTPTKYKWEDMPFGANNRKGFILAREMMEFFGTEIMRSIYNEIWIDATIKRIQNEQPEIAIIGDLRFPEEIEAVKKVGGKIIRLTRNSEVKNKHKSSNGLDKDKYDWSNFDLVLDNSNCSMDEQCSNLLQSLKDLDILTYKVEKENLNFVASK